jgi:tRNA threonylcarbamoyl adenosine modification protein YeaZ
MKILALEYSSLQRSVAAVHARPDGTFVSLGERVETAARSTQALALVAQALSSAQIEREQVDCVAVGIGPGSYNGIRSAIALAQGWQLARGVKLLGISSIECLAAQAQANGQFGNVDIVVDAQREEFYLAAYTLERERRQELEPLRLATRREVEQRQKAGRLLLGPGVDHWFPGSRPDCPRAVTLARLALARTDFIAGEDMTPIYLRETNFVKAAPPRILPQ